MPSKSLIYLVEPQMYAPSEVERYFDDLGVPYRVPSQSDIAKRWWDDATEATHLVLARSPLPAIVLAERLPRLRAVVKWGRGLERLDLQAATERGVLVAYTPLAVQGVAEAALLLLLALSKGLPRHVEAARAGQPADALPPGTELSGKTLGIIGFGAIGQALARMVGTLGMHILIYTRSPGQSAAPLESEFVPLDELLERSDYVSLHASGSPEGTPILTGEHIGRIKPGSYLVNTARGSLVDEAALIEALRSGRLAGAGLDVVATEPVHPDDPLLHMENVIITPHSLGITLESRRQIKEAIREALELILAGRLPAHIANPEVIERWQRENNCS